MILPLRGMEVDRVAVRFFLKCLLGDSWTSVKVEELLDGRMTGLCRSRWREEIRE